MTIKGSALVHVVDSAIRGSVVAVRAWGALRRAFRESEEIPLSLLTLDEMADFTNEYEDLAVDPEGGVVVDLRDVG